MYATCLFCTNHLGTNEVIETFPVGRRLAFDQARGRLWVVCHHCERWNLSPLEERWEAVEDCERLFRDARKRVTSENIGLAKVAGGLELVRIGNPLRPEFAAWRYGDQFGRRRRRTVIGGVALAVAGGGLVAGALPFGVVAAGGYWFYRGGEAIVKRIRDRRVIASIPTPDGDTLTMLGRHLRGVRFASDIGGDLGWKLVLPHIGGTSTVRGDYALHAASLVMPTINGSGGTEPTVDRAIQRLESFAHPLDYMRSVSALSSHASRPGAAGSVAKLPVDMRLAVEMAANEESERAVLEGELWLLEMAWREAEEVAAIADSLFTPAEIDRQLDELRRRRGTAR